jgi:hypothetical protein
MNSKTGQPLEFHSEAALVSFREVAAGLARR